MGLTVLLTSCVEALPALPTLPALPVQPGLPGLPGLPAHRHAEDTAESEERGDSVDR